MQMFCTSHFNESSYIKIDEWLSWTTSRNDVQSGVVTKQKLCPQLIIHQVHLEGTLPPYRETTDIDDLAGQCSIEDDGESFHSRRHGYF